MKTYHGKILKDESFILDEVVFIDCKLANCHLFYSGGDFEWTNTTFENCHFHFRGPAKNTQSLIQFLQQAQQTAPQSTASTKIQ